MANGQRETIEYEFDDLRRNTDPISDNVLNQLGLDDEDLTGSERHEDDDKDDESDRDDRDDEADEDLADDGEYNPAKMTAAMRKRLVSVKRDANRKIAAAKAEGVEEITKLQQRVAELERTGKTDALANEFDGKIEELESKIETAMEDGDSKAVASLTRQMGELTADIRDRKRELEAKHDEPDDLDDDDAGDGKDKIIPRAMEWIQEQIWWDDEDLGHVRAFVRKADLKLQEKGYKPTDDDYYEHLEALVEKKYPGIVEHTMDLDSEDDDDLGEEDEFDDIPDKSRRKRSAKQTRRRSPVSEGDRGGVSKSRKKFRKTKGKTLSRARVANMRAFGMDPEDPKQVENYLEGCDD